MGYADINQLTKSFLPLPAVVLVQDIQLIIKSIRNAIPK